MQCVHFSMLQKTRNEFSLSKGSASASCRLAFVEVGVVLRSKLTLVIVSQVTIDQVVCVKQCTHIEMYLNLPLCQTLSIGLIYCTALQCCGQKPLLHHHCGEEPKLRLPFRDVKSSRALSLNWAPNKLIYSTQVACRICQ